MIVLQTQKHHPGQEGDNPPFNDTHEAKQVSYEHKNVQRNLTSCTDCRKKELII